MLMGSIHGCSLKRDELRPNGSTYVGTHAPDFLVSGDKNLRPINMRRGPDGSIYLIDWHDQNPCHQAAPDSWDMTHGRIYKIQRTAAKQQPSVDMAKLSTAELVQQLSRENPYWYRTALRLLSERKDASAAAKLEELLLTSREPVHALRALWGLHAVGAFNEAIGRKALEHSSPYVRAWAIRLLEEKNLITGPLLTKLTALARDEPAPQVRSQLASSAQHLRTLDGLPLLHALMQRKEDRKDPNIPLLLWLAYEPRLVDQRQPALDWLKEHAAGNTLVTEEIVPRMIRRLVATNKTDGQLEACVSFVGAVTSDVRRHALEGLAQALKSRQVTAPPSWKNVYQALLKDDDIGHRELARRLAVSFQDREAIARALAFAQDGSKSTGARVDALRDLALAHPPEAQQVLRDLLLREEKLEIRVEACRALASYDSPELAGALLRAWKAYPPALRGEAVSLLAGRKTWAKDLLTAVGKGLVPRTDLNDNTILRIRAFNDKALNSQIETVWGRFRDSPKELAALIDKMRDQLYEGPASFARQGGVREPVAKCHKFDGKGHEVGPNLEGAARDIEYLIVNIIDPNRVVGQPYYIRTVELKSGRIESGLLFAEDEQTLTLKVENDVLKVIQKKDIEGKVLIQDKSMMPEGLANNMTVQDFRDLIRYVMAHPFLTDVAVLGSDSVAIDVAKPLASPGVHWSKPLVGVPGRIPLPALKQAGTTHVAAQVVAPAPMRAVSSSAPPVP